MEKAKKKLLVFHPVIAPYRVDFFNTLYENFDTQICLQRKNLLNQKFDTDRLASEFDFFPTYLIKKNIFGGTKGVWDVIKKNNPDIILVSECGYIPLMVILYKFFFFKKYKIISIIDDSYDMIVGGAQFSWKHSLAEKILCPFFSEVINVEPRVASFFKSKYGHGIYFPIIKNDSKARDYYNSLRPLSTSLLEQHKLFEKKILLFVGRLVHPKNLQTAIPAFIEANVKNSVFVIIGSGDYENELKDIAEDYDNVLFLGRKEGDELYAWYTIADVFILPSYQEPFGAVTNEALLGGCFTIVSNLAGSQCLVKNGVNGYLFDPLDRNDMVEKIKMAFSRAAATNQIKFRDSLMQDSFNRRMTDVIRSLSF